MMKAPCVELTYAFRSDAADEDFLAAEDVFVDAEADFGGEAEELGFGCVAGHEFLLCRGNASVLVEEVRVHRFEVSGGKFVCVFALGFAVPTADSAQHGCGGGGFGGGLG